MACSERFQHELTVVIMLITHIVDIAFESRTEPTIWIQLNRRWGGNLHGCILEGEIDVMFCTLPSNRFCGLHSSRLTCWFAVCLACRRTAAHHDQQQH
ncbi:MAG: hypothetical protein ACYSSP_02860 [Planctomycetota bacterium]